MHTTCEDMQSWFQYPFQGELKPQDSNCRIKTMFNLKGSRRIKPLFLWTCKGLTADRQWLVGSHAAALYRQNLDHVISALHLLIYHIDHVVQLTKGCSFKLSEISQSNDSKETKNGCLSLWTKWHLSHLCAPLAVQAQCGCFIIVMPILCKNLAVQAQGGCLIIVMQILCKNLSSGSLKQQK